MMRVRCGVCVVGSVVLSGSACAQAQFLGMGTAPAGPSGSSMPVLKAIDTTGAAMGILGNAPFIWTPQTGYEFLAVPSQHLGLVTGTNQLGTVTYGMTWVSGGPPIPVVWNSRLVPPTPIPGYPQGWTCFGTFGNEDGTIVSGPMRNTVAPFEYKAFFWRPSTGMEFVTQFPGGMVTTYVADFSDAGTIGIGNAWGNNGFNAVRWTESGGFALLAGVPGGTGNSILNSFDAAGWRAGGSATPQSNISTAAVWDPKDGWTVLGLLHPADTGSRIEIDGSGWVGVGQSGFGSHPLPNATIWNVRDGMRSLQDVLVQDHGLDLTGWHLIGADVISADGRFLAGTGMNAQNETEQWFAQIPQFCYADCDGSGALNILDYICFGDAYAQESMYANCNNDMAVNILDYICYGDAYAAGCP